MHTLEYLALIWAICEKFRDYLKGSKFRLLTDNPLTYVLTTAKLDATGQRWLTSLCDYDKNVSDNLMTFVGLSILMLLYY